MGRGTTLTIPERAHVDLMVQLNMSISLMSARIHCSRTLNDCYMSDPVAYGTSKSTGRARKNTTESVQINYFANNPKIWKHHAAKSCSQSLEQYSCLLGFEEDQSARLASVLAGPEFNRKRLGHSAQMPSKPSGARFTRHTLENLSNSMPNRIFQVIQKNGGDTSY
uniref:HTH_Tnp_Tc3_1 domain-containing protein n=1 Tax=Caenorhabditis japonica TaxID=281687 RepID=A0A8R1IAB3_CAEJA